MIMTLAPTSGELSFWSMILPEILPAVCPYTEVIRKNITAEILNRSFSIWKITFEIITEKNKKRADCSALFIQLF